MHIFLLKYQYVKKNLKITLLKSNLLKIKNQSFIFISLPDMDFPIFPSLDDIYDICISL